MKTNINISHSGNLGDENRQRMTVDQENLPKVMRLLTDMYENRILAAIREVACNAWDSHTAAGITDPIEVFRPTTLFPVFVVKDHGVGMSLDTIYNVFGKYGASSKTETDAQTGMFGLGAKAPLTYTSQFTLITRHDGIEATVLITRDEDGCGVVQTIPGSVKPTTERNGVEVQIPVSSRHEFNREIDQFFRFSEPGTVLVDGQEPEPFKGTVQIDPDVVISNELDADYVVQGQVPYRVPNQYRLLTRDGRYGYHQNYVVARVPIGSVDFPPSREGLTLNRRTIDVLETTQEFVAERVRMEGQRQVDQAASHEGALEVATQWHELFRGSYTYRGYRVPVAGFKLGQEGFYFTPNGYSSRADRLAHLSMEQARRTLFVVGYKGRSLAGSAKDKAWHYRNEHNLLDLRNMMFLDHNAVAPWIPEKQIVHWEKIKPIVLPGTKPAKSRAGAYKVLDQSGYIHSTDEAPKQMVWLSSKEMEYGRAQIVRAVTEIVPTMDIVLVEPRRLEKFKQKHPDVFSVKYFLAIAVRNAVKAPTEDQWALDGFGWYARDFGFERLDPKRVQDPELAAYAERILAAAKGSHLVSHYQDLARLCGAMGIAHPMRPSVEGNDILKAAQRLVRKYPLLGDLRSMLQIEPPTTKRERLRHSARLRYPGIPTNRDHVYEYLNGLYIARLAINPTV